MKAGNDMDLGLDRYGLDRGIESISRTSRPDTPLPETVQMPPAAQLSRPELERLLQRPTLQGYLTEQLQPRIADRQVLIPQRFEHTLNAAAKKLRDGASGGRDRDDTARKLGKAARLLADEVSLRELLNMYRSTLYQG